MNHDFPKNWMERLFIKWNCNNRTNWKIRNRPWQLGRIGNSFSSFWFF